MNQYVINIIKHISNYTYVIVNADNEHEARLKALEAYNNGELNMLTDVTGVDAFNCGTPDQDELTTMKQIY